ncbi:diguanylate cyclase [Eubacteriaceae bacterium ES2]|nr:diguanylate cyclase [Eubacteriaceae bacterium ES2]
MQQCHSEISLLVTNYLDAYFLNRNLNDTMKLFGKPITGFGTGLSENAYHYDDFIRLFNRDFEEAPEKVEYDITQMVTHFLNEGVATAACQLNIKTRIMNQDVKLNFLRLSLIFIKIDHTWLIHHMHISLPTDAHDDDESYPIKELEERNQLLEKLVVEKTQSLNKALKEISKLAITDKLTGIFNRNRIEEDLKKEIQLVNRYRNQFSIILIDIDHFKEVNDGHGHVAGDTMLKEFATVLKNYIRETDILGRWGGEEFLIICPETKLNEACNLAEKLCYTIATFPFQIKNKTASFGVASCLADDNYDSLINRADQALYQSKRQGRNRVTIAQNC